MEPIIDFIVRHAQGAHWLIFGAIILAGLNVPISADLMLIISAVLAATVIPAHAVHLFLAVYLGCVLSAWVAYWLGRVVGPRLLSLRFFSKMLSLERLLKMRHFYDRYGFWTLMVGRFIPFGVRNCLFMSTGMSKLPFVKFVWRDLIACFIWSSCGFYLFYLIGQNYQLIYQKVKVVNLFLFLAFAVTGISFFWYKRKKLKCSKN